MLRSFVLGIALFMCALVGSVQAQDGWRIETVPMIDTYGEYPSLAIDDQWNSHIGFMLGGTRQDLGYVRMLNGVWQAPEYPDTTGNVGYSSSMALDLNGNPHIAYYNGSTNEMRCVSKIGGEWRIEVVMTDCGTGNMRASLAVDRQGNPHIAFTRYSTNSLIYAHRQAGQWSTEVVIAGQGTSSPSLALDESDRPHLAYSRGDLWYTTKVGGSWQHEHVGSAPSGYPSLCLNREGHPRIASRGNWNVISYASRENGEWVVEETGGNAGNPSMTLDGNDLPHIAGFDSWGGQSWLVHIWKTEGAWDHERIESNGGGGYNSIRIDRQENPRIAYTGIPASLKCARLTGPIEIVSVASDAPFYESGVDVAQLSVITRRHSGEGPVSLSLDLHPTFGPDFHVGDDSFDLPVGTDHVSSFSWPVPDSSYVFECDADVSVDDGTRAFWHKVVRTIFTAVKIRPSEVVEYMDLVFNCQLLDPTEECLWAIRAALPQYATPAAVALFYQNMCRAEAFWKRGDRPSGNAAWNAGIMEPFVLTLDALAGFAGAGIRYEIAKGFYTAGTSAMTCIKADLYREGGGGAGFRGVGAGEFVDSMSVWMEAGIDSTENDIVDVFFVEGDCDARVEADGNWTDADSIGLVAALVLRLDELGSAVTVTRHVHSLENTEEDNPLSASTWVLRSRNDQPINLGFLHTSADSSRSFIRYDEFMVTGATIMTASVADTMTTFPLFVDYDGDGSPEEIHYPGGIVVDAATPTTGAIRTVLLGSRPNPFGRLTTIVFTLASQGKTTLSIYDASGRLVAKPFDWIAGAGRYSVTWDGRSSDGKKMPAGVYFARLEASGSKSGQRLVVLR